VSRGNVAMPDPQHIDPGQPVPVARYYRAQNALGTPIERVVSMCEDEPLPPLPKSCTWVLMDKW
jgi:hypothetical protein